MGLIDMGRLVNPWLTLQSVFLFSRNQKETHMRKTNTLEGRTTQGDEKSTRSVGICIPRMQIWSSRHLSSYFSLRAQRDQAGHGSPSAVGGAFQCRANVRGFPALNSERSGAGKKMNAPSNPDRSAMVVIGVVPQFFPMFNEFWTTCRESNVCAQTPSWMDEEVDRNLVKHSPR